MDNHGMPKSLVCGPSGEEGCASYVPSPPFSTSSSSAPPSSTGLSRHALTEDMQLYCPSIRHCIWRARVKITVVCRVQWNREIVSCTMLCSTAWHTFVGLYSMVPPDLSKHLHRPFNRPTAHSTTDRVWQYLRCSAVLVQSGVCLVAWAARFWGGYHCLLRGTVFKSMLNLRPDKHKVNT